MKKVNDVLKIIKPFCFFILTNSFFCIGNYVYSQCPDPASIVSPCIGTPNGGGVACPTSQGQVFCVGDSVCIVLSHTGVIDKLYIAWDNYSCDSFPGNNIPDTVTHFYPFNDLDSCVGLLQKNVEVFITQICGGVPQLVGHNIIPINIRFKPDPRFTASNPICTDEFHSLTPICNVNQPYHNWKWDGNTFSTTASASFPPPIIPPGNHVFSHTAGNGCDTLTYSTTTCVLDPPNPNFGLSSPRCVPFTLTATNTSNSVNNPPCSASSWRWLLRHISSIPGCGNTIMPNDTAFTQNYTHAITQPGTYILTLRETNACGTVTIADTIFAQTRVQVSLTPVPDACLVNSVCPSIAAITCAGSPNQTYQWDFPGASPSTYSGNPPPCITYPPGGGNFTYTLTIIGTCGATPVSDSFSIVNSVTAVTGNDTTICSGDSITLHASGGSGYSWSPTTGLNNPTSQNPRASPGSTTTYTVTVTSGNCPADNEDITVTVIPAPNVNAGTDASVCSGDSIALSASGGTTYSWSPSIGLSNPNIANPMASPGFNITYTVTSTTGSCSSSDAVNVSVVSVNTFAGFDVTICTGTGTQLNASGGTTYSWSPAAGLSNPNIATPFATPATTTTYTVTATTNSCSDVDAVTITVDSVVADAGNNITICSGDTVMLGASGGSAYSWSPPTGLSNPNISNPLAHPDITTTYYVTISNVGCSSSDSIIITVNPLPQVLINSPDDTLCVNANPVQFIANLPSGTWSGAGTDSFGMFNPTIAGSGQHTITYTYTDPTTTCTASNQTIITVTSLPQPHIAVNIDTGCSPFIIEILSIDINDVTDSIALYLNNNVIITGNYSTILNTNYDTLYNNTTADITYWAKIIFWNSCGSSSDSVPVTVIPNNIYPFFNVNVTDLGCPPALVYPTNMTVPIGNNTYTWDWGDNTGLWQGIDTSHTYLSGGEYILSMVACMNDNTCPNSPVCDTFSTALTVDTAPALQYNYFIPPCTDSVFFSAAGASTYQWNFGDNITSSMQNPVHVYSPAGNYTVSLTGLDIINGCNNNVSIDIIVEPILQLAINPLDTFLCQQNPLPFINSSQQDQFWYWDFGDGNTSSLENPIHTYSDSGTYTGNFVVSNNLGCIDSTSFSVIVYPNPVSEFTANPVAECQIPDTIYFTNNSTGSAGYFWDFGNNETSTNNNPFVIYTIPGNYTIFLIAYSGQGCADTSYFYYRNYNQPVADFIAFRADSCIPIVSFDNLSYSQETLFWDFGDGYTDSISDPVHEYATNDITEVTLIVTSGNACSDTITRIVNHDVDSSTIYIPNAFTPNGDDLNEKFEIKGVNECDDYLLRIFNRWGEQVFATADKNIYWNGNKNNIAIDTEKVVDVYDVYVYIIRLITSTGEIKEYKGTVFLIR